MMLLGLPAGVLVQKLGRGARCSSPDAVRAPLMMLVPALHWTAPLAALRRPLSAPSPLGAPYFAAQKVIVPELLGEDEDDHPGKRALPGSDPRRRYRRPADRGRSDRSDGSRQRARRRCGDLRRLLPARRALRAGRHGHPRPTGRARDPRRAALSRPRAAAPGLDSVVRRRRRGLAGVLRGRAGCLSSSASGADAKVAGALFAAFGAGALSGNILLSGFSPSGSTGCA